jgi:hypothetical protein
MKSHDLDSNPGAVVTGKSGDRDTGIYIPSFSVNCCENHAENVVNL